MRPEARVPCADRGRVRGFYSRVEERFYENLSLQNTNAYLGLTTNFATGLNRLSGVPVCNLAQGESETNWLNESNLCGEFCGITVKSASGTPAVVVDDRRGHCDREYGWSRGAFIQLVNHFKEKVLGEFHAGQVSISSISGARPCGPVASDVLGLQAALEKLEPLIPADARCLRHGSVSAACQVEMAHELAHSVWARLLGCEVNWRATQEFDARVKGSLEQLRARVMSECRESLECKRDGLLVSKRCDDELRTRLYSECYRARVPELVREQLKPYATRTPVELVVRK